MAPRKDLVICFKCGRQYRVGPLGSPYGANGAKHCASLKCLAGETLARMRRREWVECGNLATTLKKAGFEIAYVGGRVERDWNYKIDTGSEKIMDVPLARVDVILAAEAVGRAIQHSGRYDSRRWKLRGEVRWALIRKVHKDPKFADVLESIARLGGQLTKEIWQEERDDRAG